MYRPLLQIPNNLQANQRCSLSAQSNAFIPRHIL